MRQSYAFERRTIPKRAFFYRNKGIGQIDFRKRLATPESTFFQFRNAVRHRNFRYRLATVESVCTQYFKVRRQSKIAEIPTVIKRSIADFLDTIGKNYRFQFFAFGKSGRGYGDNGFTVDSIGDFYIRNISIRNGSYRIFVVGKRINYALPFRVFFFSSPDETQTNEYDRYR